MDITITKKVTYVDIIHKGRIPCGITLKEDEKGNLRVEVHIYNPKTTVFILE